MRRFPSVRLPESKTSFRPGMLGSAAIHLLAFLAILWGAASTPRPVPPTIGTPGAPGGGGGGGGGDVRYIALPPLTRAGPRQAAVQQADRPVEVPLPTPQLRETRRTEPPVTLPAGTGDLVSIEGPAGRPTGGGEGSGAGPGSGGGVGTGQGAGTGAGVGAGTGGEGGDTFPAEPRQLVLPPGDAPPSVKGKEFTVTFTLDARGRIRRVDVEPPIADRDYRGKFLERMRDMQFYPARRLDGTPVESRLVVVITP